MQDLQLVNWRQAGKIEKKSGQNYQTTTVTKHKESSDHVSLLGKGIISKAEEFMILVFVSSTRWYSYIVLLLTSLFPRNKETEGQRGATNIENYRAKNWDMCFLKKDWGLGRVQQEAEWGH